MKIIKKIRMMIFTAVCVIAWAAVAHGAVFENVEVENDILNGLVRISGETDNLYQVSFCITDTTVSSLSYTETILEQKTYAIGQTSTEASGGKIQFNQSLKLPSDLDSGTYRVFIYADNREGLYRDFSYSNQKKSVSGYEYLNTKTASDDILKGFEEYKNELKFDEYFYNGFSNPQKEKLAELFVTSRPGGGYKSLSDMQYSFRALGFVIGVSSKNDVETMDQYILEKGDYCGDFTIYKQCDKKIRLAVCEKLKNKFCAPEEFLKFTAEESVVTSFHLARVWNDCPELISKFSTYFVLPQSQQDQLNALKDTNAVYKDLYLHRGTYSTCKDILNKYTELIAKYYNEQNTSNSAKPSGGGGGSGKGGSISVSTPSEPINEPALPPENSDIFRDMNDAPWAKDAILSLYDKNIVAGNPDGYFYPNNNIKREEFVKMAAVCFNLSKRTQPEFEDVPEDAWYGDYLALAYGEGIICGISDTQFGTGMYLTRQDLTIIVYRAMQLRKIGFKASVTDFSDAEQIADYAKEAVGNICGLGIINGMPDGTFRPYEYATRAQVAKILNEVLKLMQQMT